MLIGLVADAHRTHAPIAGQGVHDPLGKLGFEPDPVDRIDVVIIGGSDDVHEPAEIILHLAHRRELVERAHDEIGVANPTIAVIPISLGVGGLGNAGRQRRDDRARLLISAELERNGGSDDRLLPFQRYRQAMRPLAPIFMRAHLEILRGLRDAGAKGFVDAENQIEGTMKVKDGFVAHIVHRRVCRQAQRRIGADIADMVRTGSEHRGCRAIIEARAHEDAHARTSGDRREAAYEGLRKKETIAPPKARREIRDADRAVLAVQNGFQDGRVADVALLAADVILDFDREHSGALGALRRAEKTMEHGVAVEARNAAPDDSRVAIDKRGEAAVSDHAKLHHCSRSPRAPVIRSRSQPSSSWTFLARKRAPVSWAPTFIDMPP